MRICLVNDRFTQGMPVPDVRPTVALFLAVGERGRSMPTEKVGCWIVAQMNKHGHLAANMK